MKLAALFLAGVCIACSPAHRELNELTLPVRSWNQMTGFCNRLRAIDGSGVMWKGGGCEGSGSALEMRSTLGSDAFTAFTTMFDSVTMSSAVGTQCVGVADQFQLKTSAQTSKTADVCSTAQFDDLTGLMEPFSGVAQVFLSLD
jgi:hypothetical protein